MRVCVICVCVCVCVCDSLGIGTSKVLNKTYTTMTWNLVINQWMVNVLLTSFLKQAFQKIRRKRPHKWTSTTEWNDKDEWINRNLCIRKDNLQDHLTHFLGCCLWLNSVDALCIKTNFNSVLLIALSGRCNIFTSGSWSVEASCQLVRENQNSF